MRTRRKLVLVLSLAVVMMVVVYNRPGPDGVETVSLAETATETDSAGLTSDTQPKIQQQVSNRLTQHASSGTLTPDGTLAISASTYTLELDVSIEAWMRSYKQLVRNATVEDYELKRQEADNLDADAAYWLHLYYLNCEHAPRSKWQLDKALSRTQKNLEVWVSKTENPNLDRVIRSLDWYEQSFKQCSFLGPDFDVHLESLVWLERAVDLGHMGAQRLYHYQARELIAGNGSNLAFQYSNLIPEFKLRARRIARDLLATGHPQGYLLMARMYYMGDVYEQDYSKAYAYARAAYLTGTAGAQIDAQNWLRVIAANLPPAEIADAEQKAVELLRKD